MSEGPQMGKSLRDLIDLIHFTENLSAKIHGNSDKAEIYRIVREEFARSERYAASILFLTDDGSKLRIAETSLPSKQLETGEKAIGRRLWEYEIDLDKSSTYSQVVREGKTVQVNVSDTIGELFPRPLAYLISKTMGYEKKPSILTPLKRRGKIIGIFGMSSIDLADHLIPSVSALAQHISSALELADEYAERKRAEEEIRHLNEELEQRVVELKAVNKELEAFAYSVSHDLRAPLRHIDGFVRLLLKREEGRLDSDSSRYLNNIAQSSDKMGQLIDDLLAFSRTGRMEMQVQCVELDKLVREVQQELVAELEERHFTWEISSLPAVEGDRTLLRQVWVNLLSNAIKFTAPRAEARIEIGVDSKNPGFSEVSIFVRDNGVGFDPQYASKLFGVFQRLHREDEFEGTGIGLATVRRIIHRHGGRVWAEGELDRGATFYFTLSPGNAA